MYDRFTDRARKVMQFANQEAQRFNHEYLGTEHILLGLAKEGSGTAAKVLNFLGIDLREIRIALEKLIQCGPEMVALGKTPQTPRAKRVIEYAMEEARGLNHNYVGTEHLLLGLLKEGEGVAYEVLTRLGLKLEDVREEVLRLLGGKSGTNDEVSQEAPATPALKLYCGVEFRLEGTDEFTRLTPGLVRDLQELRKAISDVLSIEEALALAVWTMDLVRQLKSEKEGKLPFGSIVALLMKLREVTGCATVLEAISVARTAFEEKAQAKKTPAISSVTDSPSGSAEPAPIVMTPELEVALRHLMAKFPGGNATFSVDSANLFLEMHRHVSGGMSAAAQEVH